MLYRAARGDVVRRCEPSKNRFFLITQPAEPQVGCCLATLLVLLASLLVLLALFVLLASLLSLACCLAALWRQLCNAFDKIPTQWHQSTWSSFLSTRFCALLEYDCGKRKKLICLWHCAANQGQYKAKHWFSGNRKMSYHSEHGMQLFARLDSITIKKEVSTKHVKSRIY